MNYYLEMLNKSTQRIQADFDFSAIIDHNCSKGTFREHIIKSFLKPFLPGCYGVSGGQAFDNAGNRSKQLDVAIYDSLHSYIAPYMEDFIYFPCESVYGNIEIKSKLDKESFFEAVKNIESLKVLRRQAISTYHVNPMKPLVIHNMNWDIQVTNEYFGVIFAYESVQPDTILSYIRTGIADGTMKREHLPNIIVLFKDQKIITRFHQCTDGMYEIQPLKEFDGFLVEDCGNNILSEFLILLISMLHNIELKAMDIELLSKEVHHKIFQIKGKPIKHIII